MKSVIKTIRINEKDLQKILEKMKDPRVPRVSFSRFAVQSMLHCQIRKEQPPAKKTKEYRALVAELSRWGNNLNQVARRLNRENRGLDRVGLEMLDQIERHLKALRTQIYDS